MFNRGETSSGSTQKIPLVISLLLWLFFLLFLLILLIIKLKRLIWKRRFRYYQKLKKRKRPK